MSELERVIEDRIRRRYGDVLEAVNTCADVVEATWNAPGCNSRAAIVVPLRSALERRKVIQSLPSVLLCGVTATGYELTASPVAAPPYVVLTSRGPLLRATLPTGRLVIRLDVFDVESDGTYRYVRLDGVRIDVSVE